MKTNVNPYRETSLLFEALSAPSRLQIILAIGEGEACVCHLEALLGLRQAYISQQLMTLRQKELIVSRREGKYIFYRLASRGLVDLVHQAASLAGVRPELLALPENASCECPSCQAVPITQTGQVQAIGRS
jgi:DNA-binding transcriptional ArsR family regulator